MSISFVVFVVSLHFLFPIRPLRDIYHSPPPIDKTLVQTFVGQCLARWADGTVDAGLLFRDLEVVRFTGSWV